MSRRADKKAAKIGGRHSGIAAELVYLMEVASISNGVWFALA